jgi:hypothetical protein
MIARHRRNRGKDDCGFADADKGARLGYAERLVAGAECIQGEQCCEAVWSAATNINDPPVSLPRRFRVEPVDQFFSCQVLQLLTLEAASRKRLYSLCRFAPKPLYSKGCVVHPRESGVTFPIPAMSAITRDHGDFVSPFVSFVVQGFDLRKSAARGSSG